MAELVGPEHIGISLDYDPPVDVSSGSAVGGLVAVNAEYWPPEAGYDRPLHFLELNKLPGVCYELARIGFQQKEIENILGGNFRRVAELVWK
jgi:membrane dipeptidase